MNLSLALEIVAVALALVCLAMMPVTIRRDSGLSRRVVRMDNLPPMRWPNLLTRVGMACVLASFALLVFACYYILTGTAR
ncbi:MAG: hypothetical protein CPDRYMAC_2507 [uncultured Paraburkholderia sp.]|nr:MAG: hypothetical protein CPDRYDRY_2587 [uncultured Paraburkholderia sp.]CAH2925272.1 MAG: hypothetical protein CPDRYMAC_2507 [uncultured Paraburkholderia sp.]